MYVCWKKLRSLIRSSLPNAFDIDDEDDDDDVVVGNAVVDGDDNLLLLLRSKCQDIDSQWSSADVNEDLTLLRSDTPHIPKKSNLQRNHSASI